MAYKSHTSQSRYFAQAVVIFRSFSLARMAKHLDLSDFNKTGPAFDDMPGVPDMNGMMDIFRQLNPRMVPDYFEAYTLLKLKQKQKTLHLNEKNEFFKLRMLVKVIL